MTLQEKLTQIREQQAAFIKAQAALDVSLRDLEREFKVLLEKNLKKHKLDRILYILLCFSGGSHTENWAPYYHLYQIRDLSCRGSGFVYVDGKWVYSTDPSSNKAYLHRLDFKKQLDVKIVDSLEGFKADLERESGLQVNFGSHKIMTKGDIEVPKSTDDLLTVHDGGALVASGEKAYEGWDIRDPWAVVRTRKGHYVVYYATNGHGFGYDHCVMPEQSLSDFFTWIGSDLSIVLKATLGRSRA